MSEHPSHESDRTAAFRGLILGAVALLLLIVTIVRLTNAHYAGEAGPKAASSPLTASAVALDA